MFLDGRTPPGGAALGADLAIIGAGAAGITLARALAGRGLKIALIESGGLEWSEAAADLGAGSLGEQHYGDLAYVRLRQFGGTTGHWGGWCRELDAIDFEPRDFVPLSGWPIAKSDLAPFYPEAQSILQLGPARYDDFAAVAAEAKAEAPIAPGGDMEAVLFEFSPPTRMGEVYRAELEQSDVAVWLNTTVSDIRLSDDLTTVTGLVLSRDGAPPLAMAVRHVVAACGGLSNPQLLLNADSQVAGGIGNARDQVGRCFAEHPIVETFAAILALGPATGAPFAATVPPSSRAPRPVAPRGGFRRSSPSTNPAPPSIPRPEASTAGTKRVSGRRRPARRSRRFRAPGRCGCTISAPGSRPGPIPTAA